MVGSEGPVGVLGCLAHVPGPRKCRVLLGMAFKGPLWGHVPEWVALAGAQDALRAAGQRQQVMRGAPTPRRGEPGRDVLGAVGVGAASRALGTRQAGGRREAGEGAAGAWKAGLHLLEAGARRWQGGGRAAGGPPAHSARSGSENGPWRRLSSAFALGLQL